ncbi:hypothetical protein BHU72_10585 [Desulfuribacillus stibiiarsenatis]|uniref:Uncharacterized protein n=1 Tax=Desulfuribacillus stibiiarsenatis TaxID=1390249 RepID=A0A1E5L2I9_9FIRM|nr:hypothetical protein BHU72_10585 [Desulfuribacillus stibiiarsenatis]
MKNILLDAALNDIRTIRDSIGDSKSASSQIYKFMLYLGIINLIYFTIITVGAITLDLYTYQIASNTSKLLTTFLYVAVFIYFMKIYKKERSGSNKYYFSFLCVFAGVTFLLPIMMLLIRIMLYYMPFSNEKIVESIVYLQNISMLSNILLFCTFIIICAVILRKIIMSSISAIIIFVYLVLSGVYNDIEFMISYSRLPTSISLVSLYYHIVISFGFIILAIILRNGCGAGCSNGNQ